MAAASARKPILISGAGLASLLFAQSLRRASIPFEIFERDASISFRAQGYRLRLSAQGLDAIEAVLDKDHFKRFWDACGKTGGAGLTALDAFTGEPLPKPEAAQKPPDQEARGGRMQLESRGGQTVGISRGDMRKVFLQGCEDRIHWSHNVTGYELTGDGVHANFQNGGKSVEGAMLVAGDGIYSRIAQQLSKGRLKTFDTGARGIHGQAPTAAFKQLGEGVWRVSDESRAEGKVFIITNVRSGDMDDPDVHFGWTMGAMPGIIKPPNDNFAIVGKQAADIAKDLTKNWAPRLKPLFDQMNVDDAAFWKITCSSPSGVPEWANQPRVTVIGDAVHSMTPASGMGANTAMIDSELLGRLIREAGGFGNDITAKYEKEMRVYGSEVVAMSYGMAKDQFGVLIDEKTSPVVSVH